MDTVAFFGFLAVLAAAALWLAHPDRDPDAMHRHRAQRRALARCHVRIITNQPHRPRSSQP